MIDLCSAGFEYDAEDAERLRSLAESAKLALGKLLQSRGLMANVTYINSDRPHPLYAGELAAASLNLGQQDLANARTWDIEKWARAFENGLPLLVRVNAVMADIKSERALAAVGN